VGQFLKRTKRTSVKYIIIAFEYLTKWVEEDPIDSCTKEKTTQFIYENIVKRFGCPLTIISDQGTHFLMIKSKYC
jgi:hypothetical protein